MYGQNLTICFEGKCPHGEPGCCFECDHSVRMTCPDRCDQIGCHVGQIRSMVEAKTKEPSGMQSKRLTERT